MNDDIDGFKADTYSFALVMVYVTLYFLICSGKLQLRNPSFLNLLIGLDSEK